MTIAPGAWREVALSDQEYTQICELLGREPRPVELGMFGAMWSEHCGYKHSRPLLKGFPTEALGIAGTGRKRRRNRCRRWPGRGLQGRIAQPPERGGAVRKAPRPASAASCVTFFTMGARPITNPRRTSFGPLDNARNRYLFDNVVGGIGGYGNCLGIPTVGGEIFFGLSYNGNPLVNAMAIGVTKHDAIMRAGSRSSNVIMVIGADTGRDSLHGATFSSVEDPEASHRGVIQVGNPFLEKLLLEACLELLERYAVVAMQDLGAAGMTSSTVREVASRGGVGAEIDVCLKVPRREEGMNA
ncbi:MAG: AIR synthase-related protein [Thermomicrobiales bacterium]